MRTGTGIIIGLSALQSAAALGMSRKAFRVGTHTGRQSAIALPSSDVALGEKTVAEYSPFIIDQLQDSKFEARAMSKLEIDARLARAVSRGGIGGLGIPSEGKTWPTKGEVLAVIPKELFKKSTLKSMLCAAGSLAATLACGAAGAAAIPMTTAAAPLWVAYAAVTGTVGMGCW